MGMIPVGYAPSSVALDTVDDALLVLKTCHKLDPYNDQINNLIEELTHNRDNQVAQFFAQIQRNMAANQTNSVGPMLDQILHFPTVDPNVMQGVGSMYLRLGDLVKAEEAFQRVLQMVPNSAQPYYNLAVIQANRHETMQAVASIKKAIALNTEELQQDPKKLNIRDHLDKDPSMAAFRQTPEFKAAFPAK